MVLSGFVTDADMNREFLQSSENSPDLVVLLFLRETYPEGAELAIPLWKLHEHYLEWCTSQALTPKTLMGFIRSLQNLGTQWQKQQGKFSGVVYRIPRQPRQEGNLIEN